MDIGTIVVILVLVLISFWIGRKVEGFFKEKQWEKLLKEQRKDAILRSRAVLGGHFSEQLAPFLPNFGYLPNECRFIGKPIDFIVFKGMDEKEIKEIVFVEVKSGKARLSSVERGLRDVIKDKKVKWVEYRIPEEITKKGDIEEKIKEIIEKESKD